MLRIVRFEHSAEPTALQKFSGEDFEGTTIVTFAGDAGAQAGFTVEITLPYQSDDAQAVHQSRGALFAAIAQLHDEAQLALQGDG